jgi:hypothetical protein
MISPFREKHYVHTTTSADPLFFIDISASPTLANPVPARRF